MGIDLNLGSYQEYWCCRIYNKREYRIFHYDKTKSYKLEIKYNFE